MGEVKYGLSFYSSCISAPISFICLLCVNMSTSEHASPDRDSRKHGLEQDGSQTMTPLTGTTSSTVHPPPRTAFDSHPRPRITKRTPVAYVGGFLIDAILFGLSALFLSLGLIVFHYHGQRVANHPTLVAYLIEAIKYVSTIEHEEGCTHQLQAPTVFPILFATVMQRATKSSLSWRLEKGESLGFLDLLANCTSVVNALMAQFSLRTISVAGCVLATIWALSPVGSQASLRVLTIRNTNLTNSAPLAYLDVRNNYKFWLNSATGAPFTITTDIYANALLASPQSKGAPADTWGNVKVPMLEFLKNNSDGTNDSQWIQVPSSPTFSSLVGIPMSPMSLESNHTFNIETSYWHLNCTSLSRGYEFPSMPHRNGSGSQFDGTRLYSNTSRWQGSAGPSHCGRSPDLAYIPPRTILYDMYTGRDFAGAICSLSTTYVELEVQCEGQSCSVTRLRGSQEPHPPAGYSSLDGNECGTWSFFSQNFIRAAAPDFGTSTAPGLSLGYIMNPDSPTLAMSTPLYAYNAPHTWEMDKSVFALRFAQLLNTFWVRRMVVGGKASTVSQTYANPCTIFCPQMSNIGFDSIPDQDAVTSSWVNTFHARNSSLYYQNTVNHTLISSHESRLVEVIQCHNGWLVALLLTSAILMLAAILPTLVRLRSKGPMFALNVSAMIRDNPYVHAPPVSSAMDSSRSSRFFKDVKVKLGDVRPEKDVGHLAVASVGQGEAVADVQRGRYYE
jgi:hypothetical protein